MSIEDLIGELKQQETLLAEIELEREKILSRIESLRSKLASLHKTKSQQNSDSEIKSDALGAMAPIEKVALFQRLFRGRSDVFPKLWINKNKGTKGYAPACFNDWVRGVCGKPQVKCGECPNQAFIPVEDRVILDHLQGRHVMGIYPLLHDDTCWLLAMDFDKSSWKEDVAALSETCRILNLPFSIERSRSGNGAHIWFFFNSLISAGQARKMGCFLITETMSRRHELSMESYDRLFPNQDTMPRGGFGNLIALPLQYESRKQNNTVFLDEAFTPYLDQWDYLASIKYVTLDQIESIVRDAVSQGNVTGVRFAEILDDEKAEPWARPPSRKSKVVIIKGDRPKEVRSVLAQKIFVEKSGLPSALLNQIKRLAAFQNPEFYKKQSMRLSTSLTPRIIYCGEESPEHLALPRGCLPDLQQCLQAHKIPLLVDDVRYNGEPLHVSFQGELTPLQKQASSKILEHDMGILVAPPGMGKTVLGTYLIAARGCNTLVLVHRRPLMDQWITQLALFLGINEKEIGHIGGGKSKPNGKLDVAMIQSLVRKGEVADIVANYGQVIVDECHHLPAVSFERVLGEAKAHYILGLTATHQRRDGLHPISEMQLGPIRFIIDAKVHAKIRSFQHRLIARVTEFKMDNLDPSQGIQDVYHALVHNEKRNQFILQDVLNAIKNGRNPILLTERKDHLDFFIDHLRDKVKHLVVLQGGMTSKERRNSKSQLNNISEKEERIILATGRYIGEGFDDARLDTLFLAAPVSWKGTLTQYTGRLHRYHPSKSEVQIFDYVDNSVPMLIRMFERRLKTYRALGYARDEAPLGFKNEDDEELD